MTVPFMVWFGRSRCTLHESGCLGMQPKMGGKLLLKLNMDTRPIANKYREGKMKRTLKRKLKVRETVSREAHGISSASERFRLCVGANGPCADPNGLPRSLVSLHRLHFSSLVRQQTFTLGSKAAGGDSWSRPVLQLRLNGPQWT